MRSLLSGALPTTMRPFVMVTFCTRTLIAAAEPLALGDAEVAPRLEKFQSPDAVRISLIWGSSRRNDSTSRRRDRMSGIRSTPTATDLAVTNGLLLTAGLSAMVRFSSAIPAESHAISDVPDGDLPSERIRHFGFGAGTELVGVDEQGDRKNREKKQARNHRSDDEELFLHGGLKSIRDCESIVD